MLRQHPSSQNTASAATFLRVVRCVHFVVMTKHPEATRKVIPLIMNLRYRNSSQEVPLKEIVTHCSPSFRPNGGQGKKYKGSGGQSGVEVGVKPRVYNLYTSCWSDRVKIDCKTPRCQVTFVPLSLTWDRARGGSGFRRKASPLFDKNKSTSVFSHWLNVRVSLFINNQFINNTVF